MQEKSLGCVKRLVLVLLAIMIAGCGVLGNLIGSRDNDDDDDDGDADVVEEGLFTAAPAVYIGASWSGGAAGEPTDRISEEPEVGQFVGKLCPAESILLESDVGGFDGLTITNNCSIGVTLALCVTKGSLAQPAGGLNECATDPLETSVTDLTFHLITGGPGAEDYRNASENLSVNVFYCSEEQELCGPPICEEVSCLALSLNN